VLAPFARETPWSAAIFSVTVGLVSYRLSRVRKGAATGPRKTGLQLTTRRDLLTPVIFGAGVAAVAGESFLRNRVYAARAAVPKDLFPFRYPADRENFAPGLVRRAVTRIEEFYVMSKNTIDPVIDPAEWRLQITVDGRPLRAYSYPELLSLPRGERYVTLRCVSNTLKSNLMGTAEWSGFLLSQIVDPGGIPANVVEVAFIGADGHDDSLPVEYAFSKSVLLALGMNGQTLNRAHGFPVRLLSPRYYGFKSVKWLREIRLVSQPYHGTWPRMGYTKEPVIHTMSYIDRFLRENEKLRVGGVSFAGERGIRSVEVRAGTGPWTSAMLEQPLSEYTWTRWKGELIIPAGATLIEARAMDGAGKWQAEREIPLFPGGVAGPTRRNLS